MALTQTRSRALGDPGQGQPADFEGRMIAEAVRLTELAEGRTFDEAGADALARAGRGDLERRIVARARRLSIAPQLFETLGTFKLALRLSVVVAGLFALAAGAATSQAALSAPEGQPVNFHWALLGLLGVETLTLLLWLLFTLFAPKSGMGVSLGGATAWIARRLAGWLNREKLQGAMLRSASTTLLSGGLARWTLGAVTHGLWLTFLLGALAMALLILGAKQVIFGWQTTILSEAVYLPVTQGLAVLPKLAGFVTPTPEQILASRWTGAGPLAVEASGAWAGLLAGSLLFYGILPRAVLLAICLVARQRAKSRFRLDLGLPGYARLRERLMPSVEREGIVDADREPRERDLAAPAIPTIDRSLPLALLGVEVDGRDGFWPPHLAGPDLHDFGIVDSRADRQRVLAGLGALRPGLVLVAVSLLTTPDRGIAVFLAQIKTAAGAPLALLLTDAARLRGRLDARGAAQRFEDWRRLGAGVGVPPDWAIEFDPPDPPRAALAHLDPRLQPQTDPRPSRAAP